MIQTPPHRQVRSWTDAEQNAAAWMRYWGFADARVTAGGSDAGVDVRSASALAQVKFEARQVGRPQLQNLVGARGRAHDKELLLFSGAGFSAHAVDYAAEMDIALFEYGLDGSMNVSVREQLAFTTPWLSSGVCTATAKPFAASVTVMDATSLQGRDVAVVAEVDVIGLTRHPAS